jgi:hypothetical protein
MTLDAEVEVDSEMPPPLAESGATEMSADVEQQESTDSQRRNRQTLTLLTLTLNLDVNGVAGADADADAEPMDVNAVADTNAADAEPYGRECICFKSRRK